MSLEGGRKRPKQPTEKEESRRDFLVRLRALGMTGAFLGSIGAIGTYKAMTFDPDAITPPGHNEELRKATGEVIFKAVAERTRRGSSSGAGGMMGGAVVGGYLGGTSGAVLGGSIGASSSSKETLYTAKIPYFTIRLTDGQQFDMLVRDKATYDAHQVGAKLSIEYVTERGSNTPKRARIAK